MAALSNIFSTHLQRSRSAGIPLSQVSGQDAVIYTTVRPKIKTNPTRESMATAKLYDAVADASLALRTIPVALGEISGSSLGHTGAPLIGLTSLLYCMIGVGRARDSYKKMNDLEKIGDTFGANVAKAQIAINGFFASGSAFLAIVRVFGAITELFDLLKSPLAISSALVALHTGALVISMILYVSAYAIYTGLQGLVLYDLSKGDELREKLISSKNPVEALREHIDLEMLKKTFTQEECIEMALEEGAVWLEKLEKEVETFPWDPTDESRRDHVYMLFRNNPEFMMAEMGKPPGFDKLTPEGKMVRFGRFIGEKRLAAKIENDLIRELGPDAMVAFNKGGDFVAALKSASWSQWGVRWKTVTKIALAVVCAAAVVAGSFFSGGLALGIPLLVLGVTGLLWIALTDGAAFMSQWKSGEISKWDKFLVGFSMALNLIAIGTLIYFTVLSGGAPIYIAMVVFAAAWLIVNGYALHSMVDNQKHPWKYQKEVTVQAFAQFLKTKPSEEELKKVYDKMSLANRVGITGELLACGVPEKAVENWKKHLEDLRAESLAILMERLTEASKTARLYRALLSDNMEKWKEKSPTS
jgi:hypothetical protein